MPIVVRPGKYLIEKTRRNIVGVIALVGTGGSLPKPVQEAVDSFAHSLAAGHSGKQAREVVRGESASIREAQKRMQGMWLIMSPAGMMWVRGNEKELLKALKNTGWKPPEDQVDLLMLGEPGEGRRRSSKKKSK